MRILHIGSGFRPWRRGGLVAYVEDLMDEQVRRGNDVAYLFSGRHYPLLPGPRLRRWQHRGVAMFEVINSPLHDHGRQPELEISEPQTERMLADVLRELRPDAVHVQELAGLPFSVLDVIRDFGAPAVVTLQDYFPLCSTFKLLDAGGNVCLRREIGADCVASTAADTRRPGQLIEATVNMHLRQAPVLRSLRSERAGRAIERVARIAGSAEAARRRRSVRAPRARPAAFQRRRDLNVERLNRADRLIAMSTRVAEIYAQLGVDSAQMSTLQLTLGHIEQLRPRHIDAPGKPLTFATLAGFESEAKGARLLIDAVRTLAGSVRPGSFRLLVLGHVEPRFRDEARKLPEIEVGTRFAPGRLDSVLDAVDVGLVPSIWEEAYAYVGMEFLAKGIPVIANAIGGMPDYTRDGETGWLNRSCSAEELARIMSSAIDDPRQVSALNAKLIENRDAIVKTVAAHADEMDEIYRAAISARAG